MSADQSRRRVLENALVKLEQLEAQLAESQRARTEPIAIVGLGLRFPGGASNPDDFWHLLRDGVDAVVEIPRERWDLDAYYHPDADEPGTVYARHAGLLAQQEIQEFDPHFFGIAPREAAAMDPQQRKLLEVCWEALENAGAPAPELRGSPTGCFVGSCTDDYLHLFNNAADPARIDAYTSLGTARSIAVGRISHLLGFEGPAVQLDTACSSSLTAVHLACQSLRAGECGLALAGGVNLQLSPVWTLGLCRLKALSPDGRCKTFDAGANGFVRGEGCGLVVLKRLSDALRDRDRIMAVIRGAAVNHDGHSAGLTVPSELAQEKLIRRALQHAGVEPGQVGYIEAHGTGTPLGDPIEMGALRSVFAANRSADHPLIIGSVKTNLGHLEAAAGIAGLIKIVLSLQHQEIPPNLHFRNPNPLIPWDGFSVTVPTQRVAWPWIEGRQIAGISSFGFSGTNVHLLVEGPPQTGTTATKSEAETFQRPLHLLPLSAKTESAASALTKRYCDFLANHSDAPLADIAFTAGAGRAHFSHREAVVVHSCGEALDGLRSLEGGETPANAARGTSERIPPKVAFLFTGQGSQYVGMGRELFQTQPLFRETLHECHELLRPHVEQPLLDVLYPRHEQASPLNQTDYTQPALFALEYALARLWQSWGVMPAALMGHSSGEYVAACLAGVFSLEDGLRLVAHRGRLMQAAIKTKRLSVSHAFHSPLVAPMAAEFAQLACDVQFGQPRLAVISSVTGSTASSDISTADYWRRHVLAPVQFARGVSALAAEGCRAFLEIGPHPTLAAMARQCLPEGDRLWLTSLRRGRSDWQEMLQSLAQLYVRGVNVDWQGFDRGYRRNKIALPTYPFQRRKYWIETPACSIGQGAAAEPRSNQGQHPLLGNRVQSAGKEVTFQRQLSSQSPALLGDHRLFGKPVLPAAAYLEMALAAGAMVCPENADRLRIEQLAIDHALVLPEDKARTVQVVLTPADDQWDFELFSREEEEADGAGSPRWQRHGAARIVADHDARPNAVDLPALERICGEPVPVEDHWERFRQQGIDYGPRFRALSRLSRGEGEALAEVRLPDGLLSELGEYRLHPVLLDAALQALQAAAPNGHTYLPVGLERLRVFAPTGATLWSHVRLRGRPTAGSRSFAADLCLFTGSGEVIATLDGLRLQQTDCDALLTRSRRRGASDWLYRVAWRPQPPLENPLQLDAGAWLVFTAGESVSSGLIEKLRDRGQHCIVVSPGGEFLHDAADSFVIRPTCPEDFTRLLESTLGAKLSPLRGVVHLWSLREHAPDDQQLTCAAVLNLVQALATHGIGPRLWLATRGAQAVGEGTQPVDVSQAPLWGFGRVIAIEHPELRCACVDLDPSNEAKSGDALFQEVANSDGQRQIAHRGGVRLAAGLVRHSLKPDRRLHVPASPYQLRLPEYGMFEGFCARPIERRGPGPGEAAIAVEAVALNFRDVLRAMGMLQPYDKCLGITSASDVPFGFECAGVVVGVGEGVEEFAEGDEVVAVASGSLSSHITVDARNVIRKPERLSLVEAAAAPVAFMTACHALERLARLQPGQRVLIHAAAGGVGQAAMQIAASIGAEIYATASPGKWEFLKSLNVRHVMNSRTADFADEVLEQTDGRGVDVVLNSLNGEFIPAGLKALAEGGAFVELGKIGVWTCEQVAEARPDVRYFAFDLGEEEERRPGFMRQLAREIMARLDSGQYQPLPNCVFPVEDAARAFRLMARGKHVGKVVLALGENRLAAKATKVRSQATYLITGGLGALGLRVACWLAEQGATHLALVGRSGAESPERRQAVGELEQAAVEVRVFAADVSQPGAIERVLSELAASMPPLRGVVHAAGVLDDGVVQRQNWPRFERVLAPKISGAWRLHTLTADVDLDFFVCFSSAASLLGWAGQGNYAAANAFLDALAQHRRAVGLPALSINWGPWRTLGMAASLGERERARLAESGLGAIDPAEGLAVLGELLETDEPQVAVLPLDWPKFRGAAGQRSLWSQWTEASREPAKAEFLAQLETAPADNRPRLLRAHLRGQVAHVLGLDPSHSIPPDQGFFDLGMDSLTSVELRSRLQSSLGCTLPTTVALDHPTVEALTTFLLRDVLSFAAPSTCRERRGPPVPAVVKADEPIAIVGMSCRMPGGCDHPEAFWDLLVRGGEAICEVPSDRWDVNAYYDPDPDAPGKIATRYGGFLSQVDQFDAHFFGIMPREARSVDPQQRLLLEVSYEALEGAAIPSQRLAGSQTGVFFGLAGNDYQILLTRDHSRIDAYMGTGTTHSTASGRLSYALGLQGPAVSIDTACSSALVALHLACQSLRNGECDLALAGGANLLLSPEVSINFSKARMLAADGRCKSFDAAADGYVRGEGVGVVVLKRLSEARAAGDRILAVVRGTAVNQDGQSSGLTVPSGPAQQQVIRRAMAVAGVAADEVSYLEAHGTGTSLGDPIELGAIGSVFRSRKEPLLVGSVKTNIGHLEVAAGIAGLIKLVLSIQHGIIPRHLHFQNPNPKAAWDQLPIEIPLENRSWPPGEKRRVAGVSSFGFSGTNAHVILEEPPAPTTPAGDSAPIRPLHLLALSTKTAVALPELAARYAAHIASHAEAPLADVCHTACTGRSHWEHRLAVVSATAEEAQRQLTAYQAGEQAAGAVSGRAGEPPQLAFLFTGQGSQYVGMGRVLYETQPTFRRVLDECNAAVRPFVERSLLSVIYPQSGQSPLDQTAYTQPALFALELALYELWRSWGVEPAIMMGHSVGEYVAACAAGVFSVSDGVKLVAARGRLMQSLPAGGGMIAVMADEDRVARAAAGRESEISIAAINGPRQIVLSGSETALAEIAASLEVDDISVKKLAVSHAFHSPLMEPILDEFFAVASEVAFSPPRLPIVSNVTGEEATADIAAPEYWRDHIRWPVQFVRSTTALAKRGCDAFLEIGPRPTLSAMGRQCIDGLWLPSLRPETPDWQTLLSSLASLYVRGAAVDWEGFDRDYRRRKVSLPSYPFQRQRYWLQTQPSNTPRRGDGDADGNQVHPLLGRRLRLAGDQVAFEVALAADSPAFLADHRIFDCPLLPATAYLEMALAAGRQLPGSGGIVIEDVTLAQALLLPPEARPVVQVLVGPQDGGYRFELFSRRQTPSSESGEPSWTEHAWGRIARSDNGMIGAVDLKSVRDRCRATLAASEFYQQCRAGGLNYGPCFQGVQRLWRGNGEALGELHLPESLAADAGRFHLHPALLDAAIQVLAAASPTMADEVLLPVGLERLRYFGRPGSKVFSHARLRDRDKRLPLITTADVTLIDADGRPLAALEGLRLKQVQRTALEGLTKQDTDAWLYELAWRSRPRRTTAGTASAPGSWLILSDDHRIGNGLAALLRRQGQRCFVVTAGETFSQLSVDAYALDPANPDSFRRLLDETCQSGQPPLQGVVHLWSLPPRVSDGVSVNSSGGNGSTVGNSSSSRDGGALSAAIADPLRRQVRVCASTLHLIQAMAGAKLTPRLWLVTRGAQAIGRQDSMLDAAQTPLWGLGRVIALEHPELRCTRIDLDPAAEEAVAVEQLIEEMLSADQEDQIAYRQSTRHVARLVRHGQACRRLDRPAHTAYRLELPAYGNLDDFRLTPIVRRRPGAGEVEVAVEAAGLNFRDVLRALGMLQEFEIPLGVTSATEAPFGFECAGKVTAVGQGVTQFDVGDDVIAVGAGAMRSHILLDARHIVRKPANLSAAEAGSIPLAFLTAFLGLEKLAQLKPVDRVLIHAAAGGVGQAAVQLATRIGAEVFATASPGKWEFLRQQGVEHVMNSRTVEFADEVLDHTGGRGVDVVLNSLSGDFIPASVKALGKGGRFVEIGKIGIWTAERMAQVRPDASYFAFDLGEEEKREPGLIGRLLEELMPRLAAGELHALPSQVFPIEQAVAAFREMAQARHRGKVVLALAGKPAAEETPRVRSDASYVITGGLGALGLTVARWLVGQGARRLVLTGRRGADNPEKQAVVRELEEAGAKVRAIAADAADPLDVARLVAEARQLAPLRGIVHAAGVLDDGMLREHSWRRFERVLRPKIAGAWRLHQATETMELDFFVCFSSAAAMLGSPGQGNYAAANAFLDALAHQRRAAGLPATSINWGPWSGSGMAARLDHRDQARLTEAGWRMIEVQQGMDVMARVLTDGPAQLGVLPVDWRRFTRVGGVTPLLEEIVAQTANGKDGPSLLDELRGATSVERQELMVRRLREQIAAVLACESPDDIQPRDRLFDLGMDSLTSVELQNRLQRRLGCTLPATLAFDYPTIEALASHLLERLAPAASGPGDPPGDAAAKPATFVDNEADDEGDDKLALRLENLSSEELEELNDEELETLMRTNPADIR